jgi:hypothetical protein
LAPFRAAIDIAAERPLEDRLATHESRWVMPAFEAHTMTTARNWVSKMRSRATSCRMVMLARRN